MNPDIIGATIKISNSQGRLIFEEAIHGDLKVKTGTLLTPGLYYVTVKTPASRKTFKVVVI